MSSTITILKDEIRALKMIKVELEETPTTQWRRRKFLNQLRRGQESLVAQLAADAAKEN